MEYNSLYEYKKKGFCMTIIIIILLLFFIRFQSSHSNHPFKSLIKTQVLETRDICNGSLELVDFETFMNYSLKYFNISDITLLNLNPDNYNLILTCCH